MKRIVVLMLTTLALTGCITVQSGTDTDPDRALIEDAWRVADADTRATICEGLDVFGPEIVKDILEAETSNVPVDVAIDFYQDVC